MLVCARLSGKKGKEAKSSVPDSNLQAVNLLNTAWTQSILYKLFIMKKLYRYLFVAMLIALSQSAYAQKSSASKQKPTVKVTLNHIALYVFDLKKSADFYENVLQLKKIPEPFKDGLHEWFSIGAGAQLHLIGGATEKTTHNKYNHLCFSVPSMEEFIARLDKAAVPYSNWPGEPQKVTTRVDGVKQIYFQDPDGYWIEVNNDKQ